MSLSYRENVLLKVNSTDSTRPDFASGYTVTAYETGAVVSGTPSGAVIPVDAGHGFAAGDKWLKNPGSGNVYSADTVLSVTATSITMTTATAAVAALVAGDILANLGPDTGSTSPAYDGSGAAIFSDMDGGASISNSRVTASATGTYGYFYSSSNIWELIRDTAGTPAAVSRFMTGLLVGPSSSVDNAIVRFDGTTGQAIQGYTSGAPTIGDTGAVLIPLTLGVTGKITGGDELELDGALNHDGTTVGFYGVPPATRPTAYTQTFATATKTHSNPTGTALTAASGTADGTVADVGASFNQTTLNNNFKDVATAINAVIVDLDNLKQVVNQILDDLQTQGLLQ
jgi:hypothetical protein